MLALTLLAFTASAPPPFDLKDGDRVVWIGGTVAEREQKYGHWETALLMKFADRNITFRNLGWSGDTVKGEARAAFDPPAKGYERLVQSVKNAKPTVVFISYGSVEALQPVALPFKTRQDDVPLHQRLHAKDFVKQLQKLIEDVGGAKVRFVLFTPTPMEGTDDDRDARLKAHAAAIVDMRNEGYFVADLHSQLSTHQKKGSFTFTDNGLHLSDAGYEATVPDLFTTLGWSWEGFDPKQYEAVRKAVVKKNELVFHQWRPQNETYLFGFRKHEQGQNAKDIPAFEPLIADAEKDIRKLLK
jgi:lysophospholipase L1-like esterase